VTTTRDQPGAVALVTGASSGLGAAFVDHLAARGYEVVTVARDADRLARQAEAVGSRFGVNVEPFAADLADQGARDLVARRLSDPDRPVDVLVNSAGMSTHQRFVGGDLAAERQALDVMVTSVLELTHAAVGGMVARGRGAVITVSSVAAWIPGGTYSAAKAWELTFGQGLADELAGTGVRSLVVCPGYVRTEFHERAGIDVEALPDWMWLDPPDVVAQALVDLDAGRVVSVPGALYRAARLGLKLAPQRLLRGAGDRRPRSTGQVPR